MKPDLQIEPPDWMANETTQKIMSALNPDASVVTTLFVGGCVRNLILNKSVNDIDMATKFKPEEVIKIFEGSTVKIIPTGIKHGTVTAVVDGKIYEITTLRQDEKTDGRHADVSFTEDWVTDAKRRDFTMNTLLADINGNVFDPLGYGIKDAKAGTVIFVGHPEQRLKEDYLRILRFFRFHAFYGEGDMDGQALQACQKLSGEVKSLSKERITQEFLNILSANNANDVLNIMFEHNVLNDLADKDYNPEILARLIALQNKQDAFKVETRLFVLAGCKPKLFDGLLKLSHAQKNFIIKLQMASNQSLHANETELKRAIYHHDAALIKQGYLVELARGDKPTEKNMIDILDEWQAPVFTVTGESLMKEGYVTGPDLGFELKRREEEWLDEVL